MKPYVAKHVIKGNVPQYKEIAMMWVGNSDLPD